MARIPAKPQRLAQIAAGPVGTARQFAHNPRMLAYVYKSTRRPDTYVYLAARDDFARLPEALRVQLGTLGFVLELALSPTRALARENPVQVMENLATRGYHLQLPPAHAIDPLQADWGTDA